MESCPDEGQYTCIGQGAERLVVGVDLHEIGLETYPSSCEGSKSVDAKEILACSLLVL